jgi:AcrR family transcriptional regulator
MRRANVQAQSDRRAEILSAAQRCFVRAGFHGASMQDICAEAGMSPGNLYRYFPSKEALIAGIAERDRASAGVASVDLQGFFAVLEAWRSITSPRSWTSRSSCAEISPRRAAIRSAHLGGLRRRRGAG